MTSFATFGKSLPDQVERIASLFDTHLSLIGDVRDLYKERAALEREYATKLQALARKATDKKTRVETLLVVGDDPSKAWDESTLKKNTINKAHSEIINAMAKTAQDHFDLADALCNQVVDTLKVAEKKNEDLKKKEMVFFHKLLSERDRIYGEHVKSKQKYDEECLEVESLRQKQGRAADDRHADRVAKQYEQQQTDMLNSKNVYLISVAIANKTKDKFYDEDLPGLEDQFQNLHTNLVTRVTATLAHCQALQLQHLNTLKGRLEAVESALGAVDPSKDQAIFIEHNTRPFTAPNGWKFEPCVNHYDTPGMSVEPAPKIFLQNKLSKCKAKLRELAPLIKSRSSELEQLEKLAAAYTADSSLGKVDDISDKQTETRQQLVFYTISERIVQTELDTIVAAIGDDEGAQQHHAFKSSSFSIPTQCGYCKTSMWGLSKQGKTCKLCGLSVHSKCELKVPADCTGSHGRRSSVVPPSRTVSASSRTTSQKTATVEPTPSSFVPSTPAQESYRQARVLFDFEATSPFELAVAEGESVRVLEEEDGSGWVKVTDSSGGKGLVPATYIELLESEDSRPFQSTSQGSGKFVKAIYDYTAQGSDELGLEEGESIELSSGPGGGQNYADGWWEGFNSSGQKGIFPSNYVTPS